MPSLVMLHRVALVLTDVSEEPRACIIRMTRIGELGTTLSVTSNRLTLRRNTTSVLTRATRRNIPGDGILHSHCHETLKSYIELTDWDLSRRRDVSPVRYELVFISHKTTFFIVTAVKTSNLTQH
jgi:hypothetical protein